MEKEGEQASLFQMLLNHKTTELNWRDHYGRTAFMLACQNGFTAAVKMMLKYSGPKSIDFNAKDFGGMTGFMMACQANHYLSADAVFLIFEYSRTKNIDLMAKDNFGRSAFMILKEKSFPRLQKALLFNAFIDVKCF